MEIHPLTHSHAATAARLHIAGQPGTFLTSLGHEVLTVIYQVLPQTQTSFGFAALPSSIIANSATPSSDSDKPINDATSNPIGFISATSSIGKLFTEIGMRHLFQFLPPLLKRFAQHPQLALRSVQTVLYPFITSHNSGATGSAEGQSSSAELLSIMVAPDVRNQGIGERLLESLLDECQQRQVTTLDVTVDRANDGACRFYERHGFIHQHDFVLYGRAMCSLRREV